MIKIEIKNLIRKIREEIKNKGNTKIRVADTLDGIVDFFDEGKSNKDASNVTPMVWRTALDVYNKSAVDAKFIQNGTESLTQLGVPTLVGNICYIRYTGEDGVEQTVSVDLSGIATFDIHTTDLAYNASANILTVTDNADNEYSINLSEFSLIPTTDVNGITTLTQEGTIKATLSKVGQSGDYNDLVNKPVSSVEIDTLESVMNRGNYVPKEFHFTDKDGDHLYFNYHKDNYTIYLSDGYNKLSTGSANVIAGLNTGSAITTGGYNSIFGWGAAQNLTTGNYNTCLGLGAGQTITTGVGNTFVGGYASSYITSGSYNVTVGYASGRSSTEVNSGSQNISIGRQAAPYLATGSDNISIGYRSANALRSGSKNIIIGFQTGDLTSGVLPPTAPWNIGSNNVYIGTLAGVTGQVANASNYDLIIHSDNTVDRNNPLIKGNFATRYLTISGKFSVLPSYMPAADATYTKTILAKPDGTFGWADRVSVPAPPTTGTYVLKSVDGVMSWVVG